eukprot:scaffold6420_cov78-Cylindrotheca_fusiformis.AAC.2
MKREAEVFFPSRLLLGFPRGNNKPGFLYVIRKPNQRWQTTTSSTPTSIQLGMRGVSAVPSARPSVIRVWTPWDYAVRPISTLDHTI